ncbi:MAG: polysaccharide biosynthesis protein [Clostridia bacterium]|nr:polysaccharide biosynthesis protein [Clostridia bacterium]
MALKRQSFMKGVAVVLGAQILIKLFGFIYRVILTNIEGFQDVGNSYYSSGYKVYIFILALATTGVPSAIGKLVSEKVAIGDRRGAHKIFKTSLTLFTVVGLVFSLLLFFGAEFISTTVLSNPGVKYTIATLAPAVLLVSIAAVFRGYFVGLGNVTAHSVAQIVEQIINSILSVVFVIMLVGNSPEIMAMGSTAATAVSTLVALTYLWLYYRKNQEIIWQEVRESQQFRAEGRREITRNLLKYTIPLAITSIVTSLVGMVDLVTVVDSLVEYYESLGVKDALLVANEKFGIIAGKVDILVSIPFALNVAIITPLMPAISAHIVKKEKKQAIAKINTSMKLSSIIAFPCAAGLTILAQPIFNAIFPNASAGALLLQLEVWSVVIGLAAQTAESALVGVNRLYVPTIAVISGAIVKYFLNIWLIPIYGENVAPITTIAYHVIDGFIAIFLLYRTLKAVPDFKNILVKPVFATIVMSLLVILTQKVCVYINVGETISMCIAIIVGMLSYFCTLLKVGTLSSEELSQIPYGNRICHFLEKSKKVEKNC